MKLQAPSSITSEDIPAVSVGLYHAAKRAAVSDKTPLNPVEYTLSECANDSFNTYFSAMSKSFLQLMEKL